MNILETLTKNNIEFAQVGNESFPIAIECPFCHKAIQGNPYFIFNIDKNGDGCCGACSKIIDWNELLEILDITTVESKVEKVNKKVKDYKKKDSFIEEQPILPAERIKKLGKPNKEVSFEEWSDVIKSNFPDLLFSAEAGLSIMAQILIKEITNPFALVLVDVPSAGKTIALNFFADIKEISYATDRFTPASFVSNSANVKKSDLKNIDLLPRLQYKTFIIRDLATLFSKRDDDLSECLGILTRVLDGEGLNTDSGVHGQREYNGEYLFMMLAASTPIPGKVWKVMGGLGSRLFFLSLNSKNKSQEQLASQLKNKAYKSKENFCRDVTTNFLKTLWDKYPEGVVWDREKDPDEILLIISQCAMLLAKLRGVINVWNEGGPLSEFGSATYNHTMPLVEKPDRINQLFYNLCRGHALVSGRNQISNDDLKHIVELTIDSVPTIRAKLFRNLLEHGGTMSTTEVEKHLNCSKPSALLEMEKLQILGVCYYSKESHGRVGEPEKRIHLEEEFKWFLSDECKEIRNIKIEPKEQINQDLFNQ